MDATLDSEYAVVRAMQQEGERSMQQEGERSTEQGQRAVALDSEDTMWWVLSSV
jgi:hypothetical protein